jgi:DNA mismatch repair protein MutS
MKFNSILFETVENEIAEEICNMPEFFIDLNLDQVIQEILINKEEYNLNVFFYQKLKDVSTINYRLEVMRDLEDMNVHNSITAFSIEMKRVREFIGFSQNLHNQYQREKWLLDAAMRYCNAVLHLNKLLISLDLKSKGLHLFTIWLTDYINTKSFKELLFDTNELYKVFNGIRYCVQLERGKIIVTLDDSEDDYCTSINATFERLNEVTFDYKIHFFTDLEMCVLETKILEIVRSMNTESFNNLGAFYGKHCGFLDENIKRFDREIQFYISYMDYIGKLKRKGYKFTYPDVSCTKKINIVEGYDLALAYNSPGPIIPNDFYLEEEERIHILTGPNQGGKTTFARAFGQILFLSSIGLPVPCQKAEIFLFDTIYTHFSVEENLSTNAGRLKEELFRLKQIMEQATTNSIIIINELFATTTSHDAYAMGKMILDYLISLDCICLYVTHIYELTLLSKKVVSLLALVNSTEGAVRTYKIVRKSADGHAYANSIVEKYNLAYSQIKERIKK